MLRERCRRIRLPQLNFDRGRSASLLRENLNHARQRTRTVNRALRTAHDFDPIDIVRRQVGEIEEPSETLIDRNAIEQNLRVFAAQSARENRRELTGRPRLHDRKSRNLAQCIRHALGSA